jgi:hypothetical protein
MPNEVVYDVILHPDDIPRLPVRLRKNVTDNLYAYQIRVTFGSDLAKTWFFTQMPDPCGPQADIGPDYSCKWCGWSGDNLRNFEIAFDDGDRAFFDALRSKFEALNLIGFEVSVEVLACPMLDPAKANVTCERARIKLIHRKQFRCGKELF